MPIDFMPLYSLKEVARVLIFGWEGDNYVLCQTNLHTLQDVGGQIRSISAGRRETYPGRSLA
jgi:hypothetical protein